MGNNRQILLKFLPAMLIGAMCIPLDSIDVYQAAIKKPGVIDIHYFWMNSIIYGGIYGTYFFYILAAIPFADNFCREYEDGIWRYLVIREGTRQYAAKRFGYAFLWGGLTSAGSGTVFLLISRSFCPYFLKKRYVEITFLPFCELLKTEPKQYFYVMLYLLFLTGGFWSCLAYSFSAYVPVRYMVCLFPFVVSFFISRIFTILEVPAECRFDFWMRGRSGPQSIPVYLIAVTAVVLAILYMGFRVFYRKMKWRIANE